MKYNEHEIVTRYTSGENTVQIAKSLGTYNTTIRRILIRNNITLRSTSDVIKIVKTNPFLVGRSDYWLGWLASDGCLTNNNIILEIKQSDKYILDEYIKHIGYPLRINTSYSKKYDKYLSRVSFRNKEAYKYLKSLGITERKSKTLNMNMPITWDFLRGVIDGDGSIGFTNGGKQVKIEIASASIVFVNQIREFLEDNNIKSFTSNRKDKLFVLSVYKQEDILRCYDNMCKEDPIRLLRKWDRVATLFRNKQDNNLAKTGKLLPAIPC